MSDTESEDEIRLTIHESDIFSNTPTRLRHDGTITWSVGDFPPTNVQISSNRETFPLFSPFFANEIFNIMRNQVIEEHLVDIALRQSMEESDIIERKPNHKIDVNCVQYNPKKHDVGDDKECSICQTDYVKGDNISVLSCDHIFHNKCIEEWGLFKAECPLCRSEIRLIDDDVNEFNENDVSYS